MKIIPVENKIVLSIDGTIRMGKYEIGEWYKERYYSGSHFRPSQYEGMWYYNAYIEGYSNIGAFSRADLKEKIAHECADGIETGE